MILCIFKYTHVKSCNYIHNKWPRHEHIQTHIEPLDMQTIYSIRFHIWSSTHTHTCKTECLFMRRVSISEFARYRPLYPNMFKNDKLIAGAAVSESQKSNIEMVSWQVRLTDQVRYHQHSSRVFVGARLDGLLAPPASKLKNLAIRKSLGNRGWPHTHTHTHILPFLCHWEVLLQPTAWTMVGSSEAGDRASAHHGPHSNAWFAGGDAPIKS